jgi:hypothetical protein
MTLTFLRRLRGPLIAIVAIVFSASIAMAGQPAGKTTGLANAASHAGKTVPVQATDGSSEADESSETDTETDTGDAANDCNVDLTGDLSGFTHGQVVCTAAHMDTPDGYANHGAWVSHWAKQNAGADAAAAGKAHKPSH